MEALGVTASLIAVLQFTEVAVKIVQAAKAAAEDKKKLLIQLESLQSMVKILNDRDKNAQPNEPWFRRFNELKKTSGSLTSDMKYVRPTSGDPKGELAELFMIMAKLKAKLEKLETHSSHRLRGRAIGLIWHYYKEPFQAMVEDGRRCREKLAFILAADNFELLLSIKEDGKDNNAIVKQSNVRIEDLFPLVENIRVQVDDLGNREIKREEAHRKEQEEQRKAQEEAEREKILDWISALDFDARQAGLFDDSFQSDIFLLEQDDDKGGHYKEVFERWVLGQPWCLRLYAEVGTGKTVLVSTVVNYLQAKFNLQNTPVLYLYLDYRESELQTHNRLLGSLLRQLIKLGGSSSVSTELKTLYNKARKRSSNPRKADILQLLGTQVSNYNRVYIVVDALDECPFGLELLYDIRKIHSEKICLMVTSRTNENKIIGDAIECDICHNYTRIYFWCSQCLEKTDICQKCIGKNPCKDPSHALVEPYSDVEMEVRIPGSVLRQFTESELEREAGYGSQHWDQRRYTSRPGSTTLGRILEKNPDLKKRIPDVIVEKSHGRFIFAKLYMKSLTKPNLTIAQIKKILKDFPDQLDELYETNLQRMNQEEDRELAFLVFSRIVFARRPLTLRELQHALVLEPGQRDFDEESCNEKETILSSTIGLVKIDGGRSPIVRLFSSTLLEYLKKPEVIKKWFQNAELEMASACLTYLNFSVFSKPMNLRDEHDEFEAKLERYPFIAYASQSWGDHVRSAGPDSSIKDETVRLVNDHDRMAAYIQAAWYTDRGSASSWDVRKGIDGLHACAWFGLSSIIPAIERIDQNVDVREPTYRQTPLMYACRAGHSEVVRQLLDLGASVKAISARGRTPLFEAIEHCHDEVVDLLLSNRDIDLNLVPAKIQYTALMLAVELGHSAIVELLLKQADINVNVQDPNGQTALFFATRYYDFSQDRLSIVEFLLQRPEVDLDLSDKAGRSPLHLAVELGMYTIVERLLKRGADPMLKDGHGGGTAILRAVDSGNIPIVELLFGYVGEQGLDRCLDDDGRSLLHGACAQREPELVRLLKGKNLNPDAPDRNGLTPLHEASRHGKVEVARTLLEELGADPTIQDKFGRTPYTLAWQYQKTEIMDLLQSSGKVTIKHSDYSPEKRPLWSLARLGDLDLIRTTIANKNERPPETEPGTSNTALHCCIEESHHEILPLLLQDGKIPPDQVNRYLRTPLHLAALLGDIAAVTLLLDHGVDVDLEDKWNGTALSLACSNNHPSISVLLIEKADAQIDTLKINTTFLFFDCVEQGSITAAQILLQQDPSLLMQRNEDGLTALQLAKDIYSNSHNNNVRSVSSISTSAAATPDARDNNERNNDNNNNNNKIKKEKEMVKFLQRTRSTYQPQPSNILLDDASTEVASPEIGGMMDDNTSEWNSLTSTPALSTHRVNSEASSFGGGLVFFPRVASGGLSSSIRTRVTTSEDIVDDYNNDDDDDDEGKGLGLISSA